MSMYMKVCTHTLIFTRLVLESLLESSDLYYYSAELSDSSTESSDSSTNSITVGRQPQLIFWNQLG